MISVIYRKVGKDWVWSMVADNGRTIAAGTTSYAARWAARRAVQKLVRSIQTENLTEIGDAEANDYPFTIERGEEVKSDGTDDEA